MPASGGALVVRRVRELEPDCDAADRAAARRWWRRHALGELLGDGVPPDLEPEHLRAATWETLELSAERLAVASATLAPVLDGFARAQELEPRLARWCRALTVAVWGSTATYDAVRESDLDVAVVVATEQLERAEFAVRALVVWPWRLALLADERARRLWPSGLEFDDPAMPLVERSWLTPGARNRRKHEAAAFLLGSGIALAGEEPLGAMQAAYGGMPAELRRALANARRRLLERAERKVGSGSHAEDWRRRLLLARAYLGVLALRDLEPHEWALNYHALAGRLARAGAVSGGSWRTVREATLWTIAGRGRWDAGEPPPPAAARAASRRVRELRDLVDARLASTQRRRRQST